MSKMSSDDNNNNIILLQFVNAFLETSSSSESEEEMEQILKIDKQIRPKITNYMDVVQAYSNEQFKQTFRISRDSCELLVEGFKNSTFYPGKNVHCGSRISSAENHILTFIWFCGNKCAVRDVAERFGVGLATCFIQITRVMDYIVSLAPQYIKFPKSANEKEQVASDFEKISGIPGILGCIDGTSIHIKCPAHKIKSTYVNRHDIPSITLQGICDSKRRFLDVFTGPPGKIHDARVYKLSFISKDLPDICGQSYHLLGDAAYNLRQYLITPYRDIGNLSIEQINFNKKFSASRVIIENTFADLKNRFRQLINLDFHKVDKITKFIISCCVLQNLCIDNNDWFETDEENTLDDPIPIQVFNDNENHLRQLGELKRNYLLNVCN